MNPQPNPARLKEHLNYSFADEQLLTQALTHRSAAANHNERLEFLGDAVLGAVIARQLYERFPTADEGQLSRLRSLLVKEKSLAEIASEINLGEYLRLGSGELKSGGFRRASILSDAVEAVLGAIYLDGGYTAAEAVILRLYAERLKKLNVDMARKDPKTELQEWLQARNFKTPIYSVAKEQGKDHAKTYWVDCSIDYQQMTARGQGSSRRKAEQDAAKKLLERIFNGN